MFLNQITEGLRDPKDNPCWKGYHPVGTKKKNGRTVPNCVPESQENVKEGAYEDGVSDGIRGTPNRRASSIYGPSTGEYDRGYQVGLQKGKEQQQARLAQAQQDSAPYEKMSDEELIQLRKDIQQRSTERQKIYSKLRGADFSFDPKRHLPANDAELKAQHAKDNKAWHIINQVLQQRGVNINKLGESEGSKFGSIYAEQLAQQTFDIKPNLKDENEVLNLGYSIAVRELGPRARGFFRDEDFPSDFVSAYGWLQDQRQQGVAEGLDDTVAFEIDSENAYNHVMKRFGSVIDWDGDAIVVPRQYWPAVQEVAHDAGGAATEYGTEGVAEAKADPTSTWVVYDGDKVKRFKTHQGAKAYAEQHGGKVASSAHYADKIQGKQGVAEGPGFDKWADERAASQLHKLKKPHPETWHDVDPKLGKAVDKMSQAEKVKKGFAHPDTLKKKGVAEGSNDTVYPNAEVIKSKNGKPVGEIYQDESGWGCFHYRADRGYDTIDSREDAIQALKDLHNETARHRPDYTIKGVAEGSVTPNVTVNKVYDDGHEKEWHVFRGKEMIGYVIKNQPDTAEDLYIAYGHGPGRAFVEEFRGLKSAVNYITSLKEGVAEGNDKNVVVKFSAREYAAMSPEQKAKKQQEWQQLKQQAKRQLKNFTLVDTDKKQGVAEGADVSSQIKRIKDRILQLKDWNTAGTHDKKIKELQTKLKELQSQKQGVAEGDYDIRRDPTYQKYNPETHTMMYKDGKHKAVKHDQVAKAKSLGWKVRSSLKAFAKGQSVAEGDKNKEANYDKKYQDMVQRAGQSVKNIEKKFGPVDIKSLAQRLNDIEQGKK